MKNDEKIISALLAAGSVRQAALIAKVSESKIYSRLRDHSFSDQYDEARLQLLKENSNTLQSHISSAIEAMVEIANNPRNSAQVRLNAAAEILRASYRLTQQIDVLGRLQRLEEVAGIEE